MAALCRWGGRFGAADRSADYLLRYTGDYPIAVVEAKAEYKMPGDGLQQAKEYAAMTLPS